MLAEKIARKKMIKYGCVVAVIVLGIIVEMVFVAQEVLCPVIYFCVFNAIKVFIMFGEIPMLITCLVHFGFSLAFTIVLSKQENEKI